MTNTLNNTWIKICGITRQQDALLAAELGANAIGLVFYAASSRAVSSEQVASIVEGLSESITVVALFVDAEVAEVQAVLNTGYIDLLQFHGNESAAYCSQFDVPYMKAFRVGEHSDLINRIADYDSAQTILLDSFDKAAAGGTGKVFDWTLLDSLKDSLDAAGVQLVLAGGLSPQNVQTALRQVKPFGVDVSSGVEARAGIKDLEKMQQFVEGVRSV